jgi:hypothetical protein
VYRLLRSFPPIILALATLLTPTASGAVGEPNRHDLAPSSVFSFYDRCCQATWFNGGLQQQEVQLPCPGSDSDNRGFVIPLGTGYTLETNQPAEHTIETHPRWVNDGYIYGVFNLQSLGLSLQQGDRFVSEVGFLKGAAAGEVRFSLWYDSKPTQPGGETLLKEQQDQHDGKLRKIDVDLSGYAGASGALLLRVDALGSSGQDWAVWADPHIERQPTATPKPTATPFPTPTPTSLIPTQTLMPTMTPYAVEECPEQCVCLAKSVGEETSQDYCRDKDGNFIKCEVIDAAQGEYKYCFQQQGPSVTILKEPSEPILGDQVRIRVEAYDPIGVDVIKIFIDGEEKKECKKTNECEYTTPPITQDPQLGGIAINMGGVVEVAGLVPGNIQPIIGSPWWWEDNDDDGVMNIVDNCVNIVNPDQVDSDRDGAGDACDECDVTRSCDEVAEIWNIDESHIHEPDFSCLHTYDLTSDNGCGCTDTDHGFDVFESGRIYVETVSSRLLGIEFLGIAPEGSADLDCIPTCRAEVFEQDVCLNSTYLREWVCVSSGPVSQDVQCPEGCSEGTCVCPDTDGGMDPYVRGAVAGQSDECVDSRRLREYTCGIENGSIVAVPELVTCPVRCEEGACVCEETDGGYDPFVAGEVIRDPMDREDVCISEDILLEYLCQEGQVMSEEVDICYSCSDGRCECYTDIDPFHRDRTPVYPDYPTDGSPPYILSWEEDTCIDSTHLREYFNRWEGSAEGCVTHFIEIECPESCVEDYGYCSVSCTDGLQNRDETDVDCGGSCPGVCTDCCVFPGWEVDLGGGGNFSFDSPEVETTAIEALMEYADCLENPDCRGRLPTKIFMEDYSSVGVLDLLGIPDAIMEAVAYYVDAHMQYMYDGSDGWSQSAAYTISESRYRSGEIPGPDETRIPVGSCPNDYCGDCEDHAILREALMRYLGISADCAYCADHFNDKWGDGGHTFNLVLYRNKWRIMDYGPLGSGFNTDWGPHNLFGALTDTAGAHGKGWRGSLWNDERGEYWCTPVEHWWLTCEQIRPKRNYEGGADCPAGDFELEDVPDGVLTYRSDVCP